MWQKKLVNWNVAGHADLKVWLHKSGLPENPTPANFADLASLPDNSSMKYQYDATAKYEPGSGSLQVSKEEGALIQATAAQEKDPKALFVKAWSQILAGRINAFMSGRGAAATDSVSGGDVHPVGDVKALLHSDLKVYGAYQGLLNTTPLKALAGAAATTTKPADIYCDIFDVQGSAAMGTGAIYQAGQGRGHPIGRHRVLHQLRRLLHSRARAALAHRGQRQERDAGLARGSRLRPEHRGAARRRPPRRGHDHAPGNQGRRGCLPLRVQIRAIHLSISTPKFCLSFFAISPLLSAFL